MDLFTLAAVNLVIGFFCASYFGIDYRRNPQQNYLLDFSLAGAVLFLQSTIQMLRSYHDFPYFLGPALVNTFTLLFHFLVLSALYRLFQLEFRRYFLLVPIFLSYLLLQFPLFQHEQVHRFMLGFGMITLINSICLVMLYQVKNDKYAGVITFFKFVMIFNIFQTVLRSGLFVTAKYGFTMAEPNQLVHQFGWFSLTIHAALVLTGGLIVLARQRQMALEARAETDPLTGLLNRFSMQERLSAELNRAIRSGQPLTIMIFDIDHFKSVNDKFGHQIGDQVIRAVAEVTQANVRNYDLAFRIGGEEFLLCLPNVDHHMASTKAEQLRQQIAERAVLTDLRVTVSIGFVVATASQNLDELIKQADEALYQAKRNGRNQVCSRHAEAAVQTRAQSVVFG
jgi:diguanylate cyclase (GGDEF)-like protein